jgi:hypothetical protein
MVTIESVLSTQSLHLSGPEMSRLLGISLIEYYNLKHGHLEEIKDVAGNAISYQLSISPENDAAILEKLKIDANSMATFSIEKVAAVRS